MANTIESTGVLERKVALAVPVDNITKEVEQRLRQLARTVKMPGFRPGKVPLKLIAQAHGARVHAEVMGDAIGKAFDDAVGTHQLRVAGQPRIERRDDAAEGEIGFSAVFEVYPEVTPPAAASLAVERVGCTVGDAEVDKTVEILRKQRVAWDVVERPAQEEDRVTIDFAGTLDGVAFEGGSATDFAFVLGEGRMLASFENGVRGASAGEVRTFPVEFPSDYGSKELAGKTAQFTATVKKVEAPRLPPVDAEFARQLGVADGDLDKMRADIRRNLEREVAQRVRGRTKAGVMEALASSAGFDLPKALVQGEAEALAERTKQDLAARGMDIKKMPVPIDAFTAQAERRVRLGLLIGEIVRTNGLQAKPEQIRRQIEEFAQAYENPGEVIRHYFSDRERLAEVEALVVEQNVVDWVMANASVTERPLSFDELMAAG